MIAIILAILILLAILLVPVSASVTFEDKLIFTVRVLFFKFRIPFNKKSEKTDDKKSVDKQKKSEKESLLSKVEDLKLIVKTAVKRIPHVLTVSKLKLHVLVGGDDPCDIALMYGTLNAAVYPVVSLIDNFFKVKNRDIDISADYSKKTITAQFELTVRTFLLKLIICLLLILIDIVKEN